jgi:hypothetical protein
MILRSDTLYTIDKKVFEGKLVGFNSNIIIFNTYKFGKFHQTKRFPISQLWKIEFNTPKKVASQPNFEIESNYDKLRKGKRIKKITITGNTAWLDTGIDISIGQNILFNISGSIQINSTTTVYQYGELVLNPHKKKSMPTQPTGAVIAKIEKNGEPFYVGDDKAPFQIASKGRLFVGINDFEFSDNTGSFEICIYY